MVNDNSVFVMNEKTYQSYLKEVSKLASKKEDPIEYIISVSNIKVVIDNSLADKKIEIWDEQTYFLYKKFWRENKRDLDHYGEV